MRHKGYRINSKGLAYFGQFDGLGSSMVEYVTLTQTIANKNSTISSPLSTKPHRKKYKVKNLTLFNSKGLPIKKQEKFKI